MRFFLFKKKNKKQGETKTGGQVDIVVCKRLVIR